MKLKDILNESATELVARFHKSGHRDIDKYYNTEANEYAKESREYYKQFFDQHPTPVFLDTSNLEEDTYVEDWKNKPLDDDVQSPGYRGQQNLLKRTGIRPDNNVQDYDPHYYKADEDQ